MRVSVNGVQQGGSAGIPGTPAEVLLDAAEPNSIVTLDASGVGGTIPQSSIPTLPATPASVLLNASAPSTIVALNSSGLGTELTYAATRTAIGAAAEETDTPQLTSSAGWTLTNYAPGSVAVSGGAITVTVPVGTSNPSGGQAARAWPFPDSLDWELQGRVEITAATNGEFLAGIGLSWTGGSYTLYLRGNGSLYFYRDGGFGFAIQTAVGSGLPLDGRLWLRLRGTGTLIQAFRGLGSGSTPPTEWVCVSQFTDAVILGQRAAPNNLVFRGFSNNSDPVPPGATVVWRDVRVRSFGP